jgi:integrase
MTKLAISLRRPLSRLVEWQPARVRQFCSRCSLKAKNDDVVYSQSLGITGLALPKGGLFPKNVRDQTCSVRGAWLRVLALASCSNKNRKSMARSHLQLVAPTTENRTVTPRRRPNAELRSREHLTAAEVELLVEAAKRNRWRHRDSTMILLAWRHGLRVSELVDLRWDQTDFASATLHVRRVKRGTPATHPILGDECGRCAACSGSKRRHRRSCSPASGLGRSRPPGLRG